MSHICGDCGFVCNCDNSIDGFVNENYEGPCNHCENEQEPDVGDEYFDDVYEKRE